MVRMGPLSSHMGLHILLMNGCAPLLALFAGSRALLPCRAKALLAATVTQAIVLWAMHAPGVVTAALRTPALHLAMQVVLFAVALWFWIAVFAQAGRSGWRAMAALLVTGKLFCLLGILLALAPRAIYPLAGEAHGHGLAAEAALADQQLAGLMMIVACPLTYVLAGVVIAARWIRAV